MNPAFGFGGEATESFTLCACSDANERIKKATAT